MIDISVDSDNNLIITIPDDLREGLLYGYSKIFDNYNQMAEWFNSLDVGVDDKEQYLPQLKNMIKTLNTLMELFEILGITNWELANNLCCPF